MKGKLITDISHDFQINESSDSKEMFITGIFSTAELENNNKRKYGRKILEREIGKVQEKVKNNCLWGELGHPPNPEVNPDKIALKIEALDWKGNNVYGKAKLIDTPMGNIAKTLVKEGSMGISSRGLGTVSESGYVNEDFHLVTYDLVTDPSNKPSWVNGIYEGTEFIIPNSFNDDGNETLDNIEEAQEAYLNYLINTIDTISENFKPLKSTKSDVEKYFSVIRDWADEAIRYYNFGDIQNPKANIARIERAITKLKKIKF
jgi:hypothetical protein